MITMIFIFLLPMMYAVHGNKVSIHIDVKLNASKNQVANESDICPSHTSPPGLWIASGVPGAPTCADFGAVPTNISGSGGQCYTFCKLQLEQKTRFFAWFWQALVNIFQQVNPGPDPTTADPTSIVPITTTTTMKKTTTGASSDEVSWSAIKNACIKGNNDKIYDPVTIEVCKEKCEKEVSIDCKSIEYSDKLQMCSLSEATSDSKDYIEPCSSDGWVFAEIKLKADPTTGPPTTSAPTNVTNVTSCNLVWDSEEDRPLIMVRETHIIIPEISGDISDDPNRIPEGIKLIFACAGENNQFTNAPGLHTKLHGECVSPDIFKVCVNNNPEFMDLSELSCNSKITPSIIKQDNDTSYTKSCADIGGNIYKMGYIYGDNREFKDLETIICFREENQTTLWTSTNVNRIEISPSMRYKDPTNFRTAQGFAMNALYKQKSQQELLKEVLDIEAKSAWNDTTCRNHGGHCVRGGTPCPEHLPYQTSQGEPFCYIFHRCCYSEPCNPTTCTYKDKTGNCGLNALRGTTGVGVQECMKGCQCYIKENKTLLRPKSLHEQQELSKFLRAGKCGGGVVSFCDYMSSLKNKLVLNPIQRQSGKDCDIEWGSNFDGEAPLMVTCNDNNPEIIRVNKLKDGTSLRFTCPGTSNSFYYYFDSYIDVTCSDGKLKPHPIEKLGCETWVGVTIEERQIGRTGAGEQCGNNGITYIIGLDKEISTPSNPGLTVNSPLIEVCFNKDKETTLMTKHTLRKDKKDESDDFDDDKEGDRKRRREGGGRHFTPNFSAREVFKVPFGSGFFTPSMDKIYKQQQQNILFSNQRLSIFQQVTGNEKHPCIYLEKGHLAPKGDFVDETEQAATFYYINTHPQWSSINTGNWKSIETSIRTYGEVNKIDLTIYTGGYSILKRILGSPDEVYLSDSYEDGNVKRGKVPIPAFTWKVVHAKDDSKDPPVDKAVGFMIVNNPFYTDISNPFKTEGSPINNLGKNLCKDKDSNEISWLQSIDYTDKYKGFVACFTIYEFRTAFPGSGLPKLGSAEQNKNLLK